MFLTDTDIKRAIENKDIVISDFDEERLQPASYDVILGNKFAVMESHTAHPIDPMTKILPEMREVEVPDGGRFVLNPGQMALGTLRDYVGSEQYLIQLSGKSSLARIGLVIHNTAGIINPGHYLHVTLELFNVNSVPIILRPGMEIAQLLFSPLSSSTEHSYSETGRFNGDNWEKNLTPEKKTRKTKK
ncbi:dCTP deaminase [Candidatus Kaiserbacteria bacterium]|jgi:dCTP deaminase|nr:MAG: dCTP deaminase [Candidatus Kaiserbacteria bacterium]|tara:strand:- start:4123 stop:4686 length:564 start_codon:yes stop_codon:yes gene_type:complete